MAEHANAFLLLTILGFVTVAAIFAMKYYSASWAERLRASRETSYRELADRLAGAQTANAASLAAMQADLTEIKAKLASIDKVLREVA
jgi:Tfp pilus assembly protein PilO